MKRGISFAASSICFSCASVYPVAARMTAAPVRLAYASTLPRFAALEKSITTSAFSAFENPACTGTPHSSPSVRSTPPTHSVSASSFTSSSTFLPICPKIPLIRILIISLLCAAFFADVSSILRRKRPILLQRAEQEYARLRKFMPLLSTRNRRAPRARSPCARVRVRSGAGGEYLRPARSCPPPPSRGWGSPPRTSRR